MDSPSYYSIPAQIDCLQSLSRALSIAIDNRLMSPEHAKLIWQKYLKSTLLDVPKIKGGELQHDS